MKISRTKLICGLLILWIVMSVFVAIGLGIHFVIFVPLFVLEMGLVATMCDDIQREDLDNDPTQ